jgi:hypothetical protein
MLHQEIKNTKRMLAEAVLRDEAQDITRLLNALSILKDTLIESYAKMYGDNKLRIVSN